MGGALRGRHRRGPLRPRAQLRALRAAGSAGRADPERGIRQFVVGTGGGGGEAPISSDPITNSEVRTDGIDGVLELTLRPKGYEWRFIPVGDESFTDSGDGQCH